MANLNKLYSQFNDKITLTSSKRIVLELVEML